MKKPNRIARAIIDATVDRSLREIAEDPKRSIRKLTDLGKQFSRTRFLDEVYTIMQDLLRNDDSPYYTAIENLLRNTDRKNIKDFGINIGYNSFTFGGKLIRETRETRNYCVPWTMVIRYDPSLANSLSASEIRSCVLQGKEMGIYTYILRCGGSAKGLEELLAVVKGSGDCSFFLFLPDERLGEQQMSILSSCQNVISLLPAGTETCAENIRLLRADKRLYGVFLTYGDDSLTEKLSDESLSALVKYRSSFLILVPEDGCGSETRAEAAEFCRKTRMHPAWPFMLFDLEGDVVQIDRIVSSNAGYFELLENGDLRTQERVISDFRHTIDLEQIFQIALPRDPS